MSVFAKLLGQSLSLMSPPGARGRLTILQFHRVPSDADDVPQGEMALSEFEQTLDAVASSMRVLPLPDAIRALHRGRLPGRSVALTFDDGYAEWLSNVAPALHARRLPATFFVTTGQLQGAGMWHERIEAAVAALPDRGGQLPVQLSGFDDLTNTGRRRLLTRLVQEEFKYLLLADREAAIVALERQAVGPLASPAPFTADHVRLLRDQGFTIGAHTVGHPILNCVNDHHARDEIGRSREVLEGLLQEPVTLFAYPNGRPGTDFTARHIDMVRQCGYQAAVVTGGGAASAGDSVFELPRFTPWAAPKYRTVLQIGRNLLTPSPSVQRASSGRPKRIMLVENGAGFGGAVVAATTLIGHTVSGDFEYHVVSNTDWPGLQQLPTVRTHHRLNNRRFNYRSLTAAAYDKLPLSLARGVGFALGRMDDLTNRLPYFLRLWMHARRVRPQLIHGNNEPFSNREAMLVARVMGLPYVQHLRGPYPRIAHTQLLLRQAEIFVPVSRWLVQQLLKDGVEPHRIRQIYDGVEVQAGHRPALPPLRGLLGIDAAPRIVAMVGMLVPWKGQALFIDAVQALADALPGFVFLIVGGTPGHGDDRYLKSLLAQGQALVDRGRLIFAGQQPQLAQRMHEFDVVVSASLEPEPLGLVMLEALLAGCQFVGPAHGAALEVTQMLDTGILFQPGSAVSLASAIRQAADAAQQAVSADPRIAAQVEASFGAKQCVDRIGKIYAARYPQPRI